MPEKFLKRFNELSDDYLDSEMHIHSTWTDGNCPLKEIVECSVRLNLKKIIITDHVRKSSTYFREYVEEINSLSDEFEIDILTGFEAKVADYEGNLDIPQECIELADVIIGIVHSIPTEEGFIHPYSMNSDDLLEAEYKLSLAIIEGGNADILGHAGGMSIATIDDYPLEYLEDIIKKCAESEIAFEINSRYHGEMLDWLIPKLKKYNPYVSIGSDAHDIIELGNCGNMLKKFMNW